MPKHTKTTKEKMFGLTCKLLPTDNCAMPDVEELSRPFEWDEAVTRCFCLGCCSLSEVDVALAQKLACKAGVEMPPSFRGKIFVVRRCDICADEHSDPLLRDI